MRCMKRESENIKENSTNQIFAMSRYEKKNCTAALSAFKVLILEMNMGMQTNIYMKNCIFDTHMFLYIFSPFGPTCWF